MAHEVDFEWLLSTRPDDDDEQSTGTAAAAQQEIENQSSVEWEANDDEDTDIDETTMVRNANELQRMPYTYHATKVLQIWNANKTQSQ